MLASSLTNMTFDSQTDANLTNTSLNGGGLLLSDLDIDMLVQPVVPLERLHIRYAYGIIAVINLLIFITFTVTCLRKRSNKSHPTRSSEQNNAAKAAQAVYLNQVQSIDVRTESGKTVNLEVSNESTKDLKKKEANSQTLSPNKREMTTFQKVVLVLLISLLSHLVSFLGHLKYLKKLTLLFFHLNQTYALELAFGQLLSSYCVKSDLHLEKSTGSYYRLSMRITQYLILMIFSLFLTFRQFYNLVLLGVLYILPSSHHLYRQLYECSHCSLS